jgi:microcin C transport system substrate-binding protein
VVHWDKYGRPATQPHYARGIVDSWWYDAAKAAKLKSN